METQDTAVRYRYTRHDNPAGSPCQWSGVLAAYPVAMQACPSGCPASSAEPMPAQPLQSASEYVILRGTWDSPVTIEAHVERGGTAPAVRLFRYTRFAGGFTVQMIVLEPEDIPPAARLLGLLAGEGFVADSGDALRELHELVTAYREAADTGSEMDQSDAADALASAVELLIDHAEGTAVTSASLACPEVLHRTETDLETVDA